MCAVDLFICVIVRCVAVMGSSGCWEALLDSRSACGRSGRRQSERVELSSADALQTLKVHSALAPNSERQRQPNYPHCECLCDMLRAIWNGVRELILSEVVFGFKASWTARAERLASVETFWLFDWCIPLQTAEWTTRSADRRESFLG